MADAAAGGILDTDPRAPAAGGGHPPGHTACPACHHSVPEEAEAPGGWPVCAACGWAGRVRWYAPTEAPEAAVGVAATPDDAACAHHPGRRAEAVCAGSGAYVCPLCTVRLGGRDFDVHYIEAGGDTDLEATMQRDLPRPDRVAVSAAIWSFPLFPFCIGPVFWIVGLVYAVKHDRLRGRDPLYRAVAGHAGVLLAGLLCGLLVLGVVVSLVAAGVAGVLA